MRLLSPGHIDLGQGVARPQPVADAGEIADGAGRQYLPMRQPSPDPARGRAGRCSACARQLLDERGRPIDAAGTVAANPRLDQWVRFPAPGRVTVSTGRVEIGQGVLTAMLQIAAEELDVAPDRIELRTGDTNLTPNEGYTAGSQSIQFGGDRDASSPAPKSAPCFSTMPRRALAVAAPDLAVSRRRDNRSRRADRP